MDYLATTIDYHRRQRIYTSVIALTAICVNFTSVLMAQPEVAQFTQQIDASKAHWQEAEVDVLLHHLIENRAAGGDGGNFQLSTYNSAAAAINSNGTITTMGPPKTGKMVKTKWTSIETYRNTSGFHWDNVQGAGIDGPAATTVWNTYIHPKSRATMRPFRNKGWPHYDNMQTILGEHSGARGRHAFHPATAAPAPVDVDGIDGGLDALDIDIDVDPSGGSTSGVTHPSDVPDMRSDLMMPPSTLLHQTSATTTSSQSSKRLRTNTLPDSSSGSAPTSSFPSTPQSSSLPLSSTLVQSSQLPAPKRARVSTHGSTQTGISSASKLAAKITPAAAVMNMQGSINRLTDILARNIIVPPESAPVVAIPSMISRGLEIMRGVDGDLPVDQRARLLQIFSRAGGENNLAVYVALENDLEMRRAFIRGLLGTME
ncbi:hypothetical protein BD769DRAFT_1389807 [Suillus cothurnatus]|nr:hypothetical protein BD769DRAFT_1389807 [Suillus cothurnatus]